MNKIQVSNNPEKWNVVFAARPMGLPKVEGPRKPTVLSSGQEPSRKIVGPRALVRHALERCRSNHEFLSVQTHVISLVDICGGDFRGVFESRMVGWEAEHAKVRMKVWIALPDVFRLEG